MLLSENARRYSQANIETANQATIISLLHHKCVQLIRLSLENPSPIRKRLDAAQNILVQFEHSLNAQNDLAKNFFLVYDYCYCQLETNLADSHRTALSLLIKIRDAFDARLGLK